MLHLTANVAMTLGILGLIVYLTVDWAPLRYAGLAVACAGALTEIVLTGVIVLRRWFTTDAE